MTTRPVKKILYTPAIALALSFLIGGYVYQGTLERWTTDIISSHMLGLLKDVQHEIVEKKLHFYDLSPEDISHFLDNLSQSSNQQRFTIVHSSGKVLADSRLKMHEVRHLENYGQRPEIISALENGKGIAKRFNGFSNQEMLYVAVRLKIVDHVHDILPKEEHVSDHSNIYIIRLATPMRAIHSMSRDLKVILYLLMGFSMTVLLASSWYSYRKMTQVVEQEKQQQQARIDKSTKEIELLQQLANMLAACNSMIEAQLVFKDVAPRILGDVNGCVSIMRESRNVLEVEVEWGEAWPAVTSFSPHDCWSLRKGRFHLSRDENQSLSCNHMSDLIDESATLCIPLIAHGNTVGIFHLNFPREDMPITEETKKLAFTLAEHLGMALANLRLKEKLRSQALRDSLTGLYNRRYFEKALEKEWVIANQSGTQLSVLMLDLDHFKQFNDNFGHDVGDLVLKKVANLLKHSVGDKCSVYRLGGEEFAIICPKASGEQSTTLADGIVEEVRKLHLEIKRISLGQIGISVGISTYPDSNVSDKELVKLADRALYKAKDRGRSQSVHANHVQDPDDSQVISSDSN